MAAKKKELWVHFTKDRMLHEVRGDEKEPYDMVKSRSWDVGSGSLTNIIETVTPKLATPFLDVLKYQRCYYGTGSATVYLESLTTRINYPMMYEDYEKLIVSGQSGLGYKCWWGYKKHGAYCNIVPFVESVDETFSEEAKLLAVSVLHGDLVAAMALTDKVLEELA